MLLLPLLMLLIAIEIVFLLPGPKKKSKALPKVTGHPYRQLQEKPEILDTKESFDLKFKEYADRELDFYPNYPPIPRQKL